jgi:hypothetical protein
MTAVTLGYLIILGFIGCASAMLSLRQSYNASQSPHIRIRSMQVSVIIDVVLVMTVSLFVTIPSLMVVYAAKYIFMCGVDFKKTFEVK